MSDYEPEGIDIDAFTESMQPLSGYGRQISFHPDFVDITDSIPAALMLSQAVYWQKVSIERWGRVWFFKTYAEWTEETRMKKDMLDLARKKLTRFLITELRGIPAKLYYRIDPESIAEALKARSRQTRQPAMVEPATQYAGNPRTTIDQSTSEITSKGSRARAKAPQASEAAISFVKSFQDRHPWYPRKPDPKQTARELEAAKYLLDNSTQEEVFRLVDRVMAGFRGNRRKVATLKDVWENFAALRIEFSDQSGLSSEASARIAEIETRREKTDAEVLADWDEAVECCRKEGLPDPVPRGYTRMLLEQRNGLQSVGSTGEV